MEVLFETRLEVIGAHGYIFPFQTKANVSDKPVVLPDRPTENNAGVYVYGSVYFDQGKYRMWYQTSAKEWSQHDPAVVAYAESDDGISWDKPNLGIVKHHGEDTNLTNLGFHSPSIVINPKAPPEKRYMATGCVDSRYGNRNEDVEANLGGAYHVAFSADGLHWKVEDPMPQFGTEHLADALYSIYHRGRGEVQTLMKFNRLYGNILRRSWWEVSREGDVWSEKKLAIIADDFEDVAAMSRGYRSGDYNGVALMDVGNSTIGFVQTHRHHLPFVVPPQGRNVGYHGHLDISLVFQESKGSRWMYAPGRPDFMNHLDIPWAKGTLFTASNITDFGGEQRLYIGGNNVSHGSFVDRSSNGEEQKHKIGYLYWPKYRLFGFEADPEGEIVLELGVQKGCKTLDINFQTNSDGAIKVELLKLDPHHRIQRAEVMDGYASDDCCVMNGDELQKRVYWKGGDKIECEAGKRLIVKIKMARSKVYAYQLNDV